MKNSDGTCFWFETFKNGEKLLREQKVCENAFCNTSEIVGIITKDEFIACYNRWILNKEAEE